MSTPKEDKGITFTIKRAADRQFFVVISGRNNEPLFTSETYKTKRSAANAVNAVVTLILHGPAHVIVDDTKGQKK